MESNIEKQAEEVDQRGFIPTSQIDYSTLPSGGKGYPSSTKISVRPYSFGEIKRIADSDLSMVDKLATIVSGVNTEFDKNKLTFSDLLYLGMIRKLNTIGTVKAVYPYTCPHCSERNEHVFTHKDLEIEDLKAQELPIRVNMSDGKEYKFMPIDLNDIRIMESGRYDKIIPAKNMLNDKVAIYALLCKNAKFEEFYNFLSGTTDYEDHEIMKEIDDLLSHDVKPLEASCKSCQKEVYLPIKNAIDLVLPFREEKGLVRSRISYGEGTQLNRN